MDVSPAKRSYFTCANVWWKLLFHSTKILWSLDFTGFTGIFHLLSHSFFLIWPHFYHKFLEKYIRLIFLPHFTTTTYGLYHSRYGFWQVHFRHLVLHMRLLCNMIVDIHCDLCIWMFFAPLWSVLNGCPPDIQHPITYCITTLLVTKSSSLGIPQALIPVPTPFSLS